MKHKSFGSVRSNRSLCLLVLFTMAVKVTAQKPQETLTNDSVVRMVLAKIGADVIVEQIRDSPGRYVLTANTLIQLKQAGVPEKVIYAMQEKQASPRSQTVSRGEQDRSASASNLAEGSNLSERWQIQTVKDEMTDEEHSLATITLNGRDKGRFAVSASCALDDHLGTQTPFADLEIKSETPGLAFQLAADRQTVVTQDTHYDTLTGSAGSAVTQVPSSRYCTWIEAGLGDGAIPRTIESDSCGNDKVAAVWLAAEASYKRLRRNIEFPGPTIPIGDFLRANSFRLRFSLEDGDRTVLQIPLDNQFKEFVGDCIDRVGRDWRSADSNIPRNRPTASEVISPLPNASDLMSAAMTEAREQQKNIFLVYGASWCFGCHEFEAFASASEIKPILEKNFIVVNLKVNEEAGGKPYLNNPGSGSYFRTHTGNHGSIPFVVLLTSDGRQIVNCRRPVPDKPEGINIGYPADLPPKNSAIQNWSSLVM